MTKYQLVLDVLDDGTWRIDVRDKGTTIGHIMLSRTGVTWKEPHAHQTTTVEIPWQNFKCQLVK